MIYVLLAMSFHLSSMIFIPLYFLVNKNYKRVFLFSILILSIILSMSNSITNLFERIVYDLPYLDVGGYISKYLESRYIRREMDYGIVFFGNLSLLILSILWKDKLIDSQYKQVIFNLFYLYIISLILAGDFYALSRMQYFFSIYMVMFISSILDVLKVDTKRKIKPAFAIFYAFLFFYIIFRSNIVGNSNLMPYSINLNIFY